MLLLSAPVTLAGPADPVSRGQRDFIRYCASCHGVTADGSGPVAPALVTRPPDLRLLGRRYGTPLPPDRVAAFIDGRDVVVAHGSRDMPVWGERFETPAPDEEAIERAIAARVAALVAYLETLQLPHE